MASGTDPFGRAFERPRNRGLDPIGMFIVNLHRLLGHNTAERIISPGWSGPREDCVLCKFEHDPSAANKQAVYDAIGSP